MAGKADTKMEYGNFRQQLLSRNELPSSCVCGSAFELPIEYVLSNLTDIDKMYWEKIALICPKRGAPPNGSCTIDTRQCHAGFARLRITRSSTSNDRSEYFQQPPTKHLVNGPAWPRMVRPSTNLDFLQTLLAGFNVKWLNVTDVKLDMVYCVYCPSWPAEAAEWISREKKNGWPSKDVIDKIVGFGCHLVAKPHQSTPGDGTQWRFSFSQAEVILINGWTDVQKYIYHVLRLIKSEVVKSCGGEERTVLCTYFFKTLMLWACEEKPPEFWTDENLETSVGELLCQMIEWLIERCCRNYFIPINNMIDYLPDEFDLSAEISSLQYYREQCLAKILANVQRAYPGRSWTVSVPKKVAAYAALCANKYFIPNNSRSSSLRELLTGSDSFLPELRFLFEAIQIQHRLMSLNDNSLHLRHKLIFSAVEHFNSVLETKDESYTTVALLANLSCNDLLDNLVSSVRDQCDRKPMNRPSNPHEMYPRDEKRTCMLPQGGAPRSSLQLPAIHPGRPTCRFPSKHEGVPITGDQCYSSKSCSKDCLRDGSANSYLQLNSTLENCKESILINGMQIIFENFAQHLESPAYLVSMAYYANFYHTALHDYKEAANQCDATFKYLKTLSKGLFYSDDNLNNSAVLVLLTNEWSMIFDTNLQAVLGFLTLRRTVRTQGMHSGRDITIRICPVDFLKYIHFQSMNKLNVEVNISYNCSHATEDIFYKRRFDQTLSRILLLTALRFGGFRPMRINQTFYISSLDSGLGQL